jgi:nitroreductase
MVRAYAPDPVPKEALSAIIRAATRAPTAGFTQGVSLLVLTRAQDRDRFWNLTAPSAEPDRWLRGMQTAPVLMLVWTSQAAYLDRYAEPDKDWVDDDRDSDSGPDDRDHGRWSAPYWFVDAGMAAMSALLTAVDLGLGACFFGVPPGRVPDLRSAFGVPTDQLSVGVLSVGYPDPQALVTGSPTRRPRRPESDLVHRGRWAEHTDG